jgi:prepilin-type N-terminal cleavage/methylation domain-containing protein
MPCVRTSKIEERTRSAVGLGRGGARRAFTLIETMTAMAVLALVGSSLLIGMATTSDSSQTAVERAIALGMAQQLLDEICGMKYCESLGTEYDTGLGPGSPEVSAGARRDYDDIDDYKGVSTSVPTDRWGIALGVDNGKQGSRHANFRAPTGFFDGWRQSVDVFYVSDSNFSTKLTSGTSSHRKIEVRITATTPDGGVQELAYVSRVVAYVPGM